MKNSSGIFWKKKSKEKLLEKNLMIFVKELLHENFPENLLKKNQEKILEDFLNKQILGQEWILEGNLVKSLEKSLLKSFLGIMQKSSYYKNL